MMAKKEPLVLLDVRTSAEQKLVAFADAAAVQAPLDRLFVKENLDTLPTDKPIVVVCHTGARAAAAAILLRSIGFENAKFLKGGMVDLVTKLTPKTAP
jgi:rhodanese-related sulfurtransferase